MGGTQCDVESPADYVTITNQQLVFAPGETSKTIDVTVCGDFQFDEGDETFVVNLTDPVNATFGDNQGVGTIVEDDVSDGE